MTMKIGGRVVRLWRVPILLLAALMVVTLVPGGAYAAGERYHGGSGDGFALTGWSLMALDGSGTAAEKNYSGSGDGFSVLESSEMFLYGSVLAGDANEDGFVNAADIPYVEHVVALDPGYPENAGCDANVDNNVNALDITKIELLVP